MQVNTLKNEDIHKVEFFGRKLTPKGLFFVMEAFGFLMGLAFPALVFPFVSFKSPVHFIFFYSLCIIAGLIVGYACNFLTYRFGTQIITNATKMAENSLTIDLFPDVDYVNEIEEASHKFALLLEFTKKLMQQIKSSVNEIKSVIEDIQKIGNLNSITTSQLASSITEISATMDEILKLSKYISASLETVFMNSKKTFEALTEGKKITELTFEAFKKAKEANESLTRKSAEITEKITLIEDILKFIDEISAKTKILALNASIEAARAGEKGKGFSVVASEIRSLTERVSGYTASIKETTKEISEFAEELGALTKENKERFEDTTKKSKNTIEKLIIIEAAAKETNMSIERIKSSVEQQVTAINQISLSLKELQKAAVELIKTTSSLGSVSTKLNEEGEKLLKSLG